MNLANCETSEKETWTAEEYASLEPPASPKQWQPCLSYRSFSRRPTRAKGGLEKILLNCAAVRESSTLVSFLKSPALRVSCGPTFKSTLFF